MREKLPLEERARRDRASWAKSRAKTGNWSSRAYNLAVQDAARWVKENEPLVWERFYTARSIEQRKRVEGDGDVVGCTHDQIEEVDVVTHSLRCLICNSILGSHVEGDVPDGYGVFTGDGGRVAYRRVQS